MFIEGLEIYGYKSREQAAVTMATILKFTYVLTIDSAIFI